MKQNFTFVYTVTEDSRIVQNDIECKVLFTGFEHKYQTFNCETKLVTQVF